jgi:hypothetical protein
MLKTKLLKILMVALLIIIAASIFISDLFPAPGASIAYPGAYKIRRFCGVKFIISSTHPMR